MHTGFVTEFLNQIVITGVLISGNNLQPPRSVNMSYGRDYFYLIFLNRKNPEHEIGQVGMFQITKLKILLCPLCQNHRSKRPIWLPEFDFRINNFLHLLTSGISKNASCSQGPWTPFGPAMEKTDNLTPGNLTSQIIDQFIII